MVDGLTISPDALREKSREIQKLDEILDAAAGSTSAGQRAVTNSLVREHEATFEDLVSQLTEHLKQYDGEILVAGYHSIINSLEDTFGDDVEATVKAVVEARKASTPKVSDEEINEITEKRRALAQEFKALQGVLEMFGFANQIADIPEPKIRRGGRGPRGPRLLSQYQYAINGTDLPEESNSLKTVADACGVKVGELKDYINQQKGQTGTTRKGEPKYEFLKDPGDKWSAELPNGVGTLTARKMAEFLDTTEEDDSSDQPAMATA